MPADFLRRTLAPLLLAMLAGVPAACDPKPGGDVRVVVIGDKLGIADPSQTPLTAPQAILVGNVAQGLVRFDQAGNIVGGLAERWTVTDDGLSFIFRLTPAEWADGSRVTARQVARLLERQLSSRSRNPLRDPLGAVEDVVAMTDRVIEIRLMAPRPNLLALLAQPEMAILRDGVGTGPFKAKRNPDDPGGLILSRTLPADDDETAIEEEMTLSAAPARDAVRAFALGRTQLVLGGTFADLPYARAVRLPADVLRFDPAMGLFGLVPTRTDGWLADADARALLSQAIDRPALIAALNVPGLVARASILEPGLDGVANPVQPAWMPTPLAERRPALISQAQRLFDGDEPPSLRVLVGDGPGAEVLFRRLAADWGALGISVERSESARSADLQLIDRVAPSTSPAWFLRSFRCGAVAVCADDADALLEAARTTVVPQQRSALLAQAAALMESAQLFIPLTAPIRWSLVDGRIQGFAGNRYARHSLVGLEERPGSGDF